MIVCIAGMHRSGTSMVARMLNVCGLSLGAESDIMSPNVYNPEGYWENTKFVAINDQILSLFGGGWDMPPRLEAGWERSRRLASLREEARSLIAEFSEFPHWGWKDPRNSLTLPFWQALIPDLKVVICLRNPLEVARSLERRGASSHTFSFHLWQVYNDDLLAAASPESRLVTHYHTYFIDPRAELRRLLDFIELPAEESQVASACTTGLSSLRHSQDTFEDMTQAGAPADTLALYADLTAQCGPVYWGAFSKDLQRSTSSAGKALEARQAIEKQWLVRLVEKDQELQVLRPLVPLNAQLTTENQTLSKLVEDLYAQNEEVARRAAEFSAKNEQLSRRISELSARGDSQAKRLSELLGHNQDLVAQLQEIHSSKGYRFLSKYRSTVDRLLPAGSTRRRLYSGLARRIFSVLSPGQRQVEDAPPAGRPGRAAVEEAGQEKKPDALSFASHKILFVAPSAAPGPAQERLLSLLRWLKEHTALQPSTLLFESGPLVEQFKTVGPLLVLDGLDEAGLQQKASQVLAFCGADVKLAYCSNITSGSQLQLLQGLDVPVLLHLHNYGSDPLTLSLDPERISHFIVDSPDLRDCLLQAYPVNEARIDLVPAPDSGEPALPSQLAAMDTIAPQLLGILRRTAGLKPAVSVIVPCFNHADFLPRRLDSILNQTFRDYELILLDDASSDATASLLNKFKERPDVYVEVNQDNSGSTFAQWIKGIQKASSDILWIAEDDDYCEYTLLESLLPFFNDPQVRLAYSQSRAVDDKDQVQFSYFNHTREFSATRWKSPYVVPANDEVNAGLAITNTIPNASAVLFRRFDIEEWVKLSDTMKLAGDWLFYLFAIRDGKIAFTPSHLNYHRRHPNTQIHRTQFSKQRFAEIVKTQSFIAHRFDLTEKTRHSMREYTRRVWDSIYPGQAENFEAEYRNYFERPL